MKRYFKLISAHFRYCLQRELEFRANVLFWTIMDFIFLGLLVFSVDLIFGQVNSIAGWSKDQILLLVYTASLFEDFQWTVYLQGLGSYSDSVRNGKLDYLLLKPVNTRFLVSFRYFEFDHYLRIVLIGFLLIKQMGVLGINAEISNWLGFSVLFLVGQFIVYNFSFMITTLSFWFIRVFNFNAVYESVTEIGRYPTGIFKGLTKLTLVYFIPAAFVSYYPVMWLLGNRNVELFLLPPVFTLISYLFSHWLWRKGLRHYSSASS